MNSHQDFELLIEGYLNGMLSGEDEKMLMVWIQASHENTKFFADVCARWELSVTALQNKKFREETGWRKLIFRINPTLRYRLFMKEYGRIAAIFLVAFTLGYSAFEFDLKNFLVASEKTWIINETPLGNKAVATLPDGTQVWINAGSQIRYSTNFNKTERNLFLEGEAYFQVTTNPSKPFEVFANGVSIAATGTEFNVRAYSDEDFVETTLVNGIVWINNADATHKEAVLLSPSQKLTVYTLTGHEDGNFSEGTKKMTHEIREDTSRQKIVGTILTPYVETELYTSWKDDEWIIKKENFTSLAVKLERRYDVKINFSDGRIGELAYSGRLKDETLQQVMNVICQTSPILYRLDGKTVTVWYNEKFNKK
jgi:transmembrane sensor